MESMQRKEMYDVIVFLKRRRSLMYERLFIDYKGELEIIRYRLVKMAKERDAEGYIGEYRKLLWALFTDCMPEDAKHTTVATIVAEKLPIFEKRIYEEGIIHFGNADIDLAEKMIKVYKKKKDLYRGQILPEIFLYSREFLRIMSFIVAMQERGTNMEWGYFFDVQMKILKKQGVVRVFLGNLISEGAILRYNEEISSFWNKRKLAGNMSAENSVERQGIDYEKLREKGKIQ